MQPAENHSLSPRSRQETPQLAIPVTYRQEWRDGFGARGWRKLLRPRNKLARFTVYLDNFSGCQILRHLNNQPGAECGWLGPR